MSWLARKSPAIFVVFATPLLPIPPLSIYPSIVFHSRRLRICHCHNCRRGHIRGHLSTYNRISQQSDGSGPIATGLHSPNPLASKSEASWCRHGASSNGITQLCSSTQTESRAHLVGKVDVVAVYAADSTRVCIQPWHFPSFCVLMSGTASLLSPV